MLEEWATQDDSVLAKLSQNGRLVSDHRPNIGFAELGNSGTIARPATHCLADLVHLRAPALIFSVNLVGPDNKQVNV